MTKNPTQALTKPAAPHPIQVALNNSQGEFARLLGGDQKKAERFARAALTACKLGFKLMECKPQTVIASCMKAAQYDLEVGQELGQAYLIAYGNDCQLQIGYQGLLELAQRSGVVQTVIVEEVYSGDEFSQTLGSNPELIHVPAEWGTERGEVIGFYACVKTVNGGTYFTAWDRARCMAHGQRFSKSFSKPSSPWKTNPDAMCKKTVLKQTLKLIPKSVELKRAVFNDEVQDLPDDMKIPEADYTVQGDNDEND